MSKPRKNRTFSTVLILTILLAAASAGCIYYSRQMVKTKETRLEVMQAEAKARNEEKEREYQVRLAEFKAENTGGVNIAWPEAKREGWDVVDLTTYPLESPVRTDIDRQELLYNGMLLVNQWHSRPQDFDESKTVKVKNYSKGVIRAKDNNVALLPSASDAWIAILKDAEVQKGYKYYMLEEGFRSYEAQQKLFDAQKQHLKSRYSDEEELNAATAKRVNLPGTSEYNTGLSAEPRLYENGNADVNTKDNSFFESEEGLWLLEHAPEYGFVFRFPLADYPVKGTLDKSYKTGVSSRLRLFRYVGVPNAMVMNTLGLCLEEYIDYLAEHPHIAVFQNGTLRYEIIREHVGDGETVTVTQSNKPGVQAVESMLDNMGYVITIMAF